jgi:hypothetical protein
MFAIPWYVVLFVSIPESFLIIILGLALFNLEIPYKKAGLISVISAICSYFVRQLPVIFGLHTLIGVLVLTGLLIWLGKVKPWEALISISGGFVIYFLLESFLLPLFFLITSKNQEIFVIDPRYCIVYFVPIAVITVLLYFILKKYHLYIYDLKAGKNESE